MVARKTDADLPDDANDLQVSSQTVADVESERENPTPEGRMAADLQPPEQPPASPALVPGERANTQRVGNDSPPAVAAVRQTPTARGPSRRSFAEPSVGDVLKGRYRLDERIGKGGMGIVFRATDLAAIRLGRATSKVAVKVLRPELWEREAALLDEVEKTRSMQQENIIDVYGFEPDAAGGFMVMEYLTGLPLDRFVTESWAEGMPYALAAPYVSAMGSALAYAHKHGVIHSDFKPSNVFVIAASAKVLDFGIARAARAGGKLDAPGEKPIGLTAEFASCEMLDRQPADNRDDVFCFALVVYFLLSGRHPFGMRATAARDERLAVPPIRGLTKRQNSALKEALRFDRFERTSSVDEVVQELQAGAVGPNRAGLWAALAGSVLLAGGLGYLYYDKAYGLQDSDNQFVLNLCKSVSNLPRTSADDRQTVSALMEQGNNYLRLGKHPFNPGLLSENVSSALGAFQDALSLGPDDCEEAAAGVLKVATAYKDEARRLFAAHEYRKAEQMTKIALRIWADSADMQDLLYKVMRYTPPETDAPR
jgi:serine/threonine protein kinase